jgi:hypothetical protein
VWVQVFVLALLFLGGGVAGLGIARAVAPGSFAAEFFGTFAFPLAFGIGMQSWVGTALATEAWRTIRRGFRPAPDRGKVRIPPGSFAFVPPSVLLVGGAGLLDRDLRLDSRRSPDDRLVPDARPVVRRRVLVLREERLPAVPARVNLAGFGLQASGFWPA